MGLGLSLALVCTLLLGVFVVIPSRGGDGYSRGTVSGLFVVLAFTTQTGGSSWRYPFVCGVGLIVLGAFRARQHTPRTMRRDRTVAAWTAVLWGYTALAAYMSGVGHTGRLVALAMFLIAVAHFAREFPPGQVTKIYAGIVGICLLEVVAGFWQFTGRELSWVPVYANGATPNPLPGVGDHLRVSGTLQHAIPYSVVLGVGLVIALANPMRWKRRWCGSAAAVIAAGIYMSGSRSAFLASAVAVVAYFLQGVDTVRWLRNAAVLSVIGAFVAYVFGARIGQVNNALHESGSYTQRASSASAFPDLLRRPGTEEWFGSGYANVKDLYDKGYLASPFKDVFLIDNWYVYVLGTLGLVGFLIFTAMTIHLFWRANRLGRALVALLAASSYFFDMYTWYAMAFSATLIFAVGATEAVSERDSPVASVPERYAHDLREGTAITRSPGS